jgi:hypothetical protein
VFGVTLSLLSFYGRDPSAGASPPANRRSRFIIPLFDRVMGIPCSNNLFQSVDAVSGFSSLVSS